MKEIDGTERMIVELAIDRSLSISPEFVARLLSAYDALRAENERMRKALEEIRDTAMDWERGDGAMDIAREALEGGEK